MIWGGEFGRTPMVEIRKTSDPENAGRDHHPLAYSMWLAGGGIKGGQVVGKTDDLGFNIVEDKIHVHDLQATILQLPRLRSHAADVSLHGPRFPADGCGGECGEEAAGVNLFDQRDHSAPEPEISGWRRQAHRATCATSHRTSDDL